MATYGPWIQGADYERSSTDPSSPGNAARAFHKWSFQGRGAPFDDELNDALNATPEPWEAITSSGPSSSLEVTGVVGGSGFDYGSLDVRRDQDGSNWSAETLLDLDYYYANHLSATMPADAVGVEYEANAVTPVGALLHLVMKTTGADDTIPIGITAVPAVSLEAFVLDDAGTNLVSYSALPGESQTFDFDFSATMGPLGQVGIFVKSRKTSTWAYYDPNRLGPISCITRATPDTTVKYTLRPPRHRWVYAAIARRSAPNRIVQRGSDGLGMTGGKRIVQNRTMQSTNRRGAAIR